MFSNYFAAGAAGASAGFASSFLTTFFAFFTFLAGLAAFSPTGGWPAGIAGAASLAGSAAQTIPAKETATRAATMDDNTFFMIYSPFSWCDDSFVEKRLAFVVP
jgi:hypothetical protein